MQNKEKLDFESFISGWHLVCLVERGIVSDRTSIKCAIDYLTAYADLYADENCRYRARKIKNQTK